MTDAEKKKRKLDILQHFRMEVDQHPEAKDVQTSIHQTQLCLGIANIVELEVDAVVNAAQPKLTGGGGVDGAIHGHGGPDILKECLEITKKIGTLETGKAVMTTGGQLPASHVIHTVGPIWRGGKNKEAELLASSYRECLQLADLHQIRSIGFPSISTGAYGYPVIEAAQVAMKTVINYLETQTTGLRNVRFAIFSQGDLGAYRWALQNLAKTND